MAPILILCPTYNHADALYFSLASVRAQTRQDWRLHVIGDGAPDRTRDIVAAISAVDPRISFSFHPKAPRHGEEHRGPLILSSGAEYVFHLNDDDIWLPDHLERMMPLFDHADWINQAPLRVAPDGTAKYWPVNHGTAACRDAVSWVMGASAGINYVAYRRSCYAALLHGWAPAPRELGPTDRFQWSKFMCDPRVSVASTAESTVLKLPSFTPERIDLAPEARGAELGPWLARSREPGLARSMVRSGSVLQRMGQLMRVQGAWTASDPDEMLLRLGMIRAGPEGPADIALDGAPMQLPLTDAQFAEVAEAFAGAGRIRRLLSGSEARATDFAASRPGAWIDLLLGLSRLDADHAGHLLDRHWDQVAARAHAHTLKALLAHGSGRSDAARAALRDAAMRWPGSDWPAMMQARLDAGLPAPRQ